MEKLATDREQIGHRLRMIRQHLKLSQKDLGEKLSISGCYLSMLESGLRQPSEHLLRLLCLTQGVSRQWLKCGRGQMFCGEISSPEGDHSRLSYDRERLKYAIHLVMQASGGTWTEERSELILDCYEQLILEGSGDHSGSVY